MTRPGKLGMHHRIGGTVLVGIALLVLGILLLLDTLQVLQAGALLAGWWPVIVVGAGLWWAVTGTPFAGTTTAVVGGLLLAVTQDLVSVSVGRLVLPGLALIVGSALLQAGLRLRTGLVDTRADTRARSPSGRNESETTGDDHHAFSPAGPVATAVFGDARLNVAGKPTGSEGEVVDICATAVFGNVRVQIPAGWRVEDRITKLLGSVTVPKTQPPDPASPLAVLNGAAIFGDVQVSYGNLEED